MMWKIYYGLLCGADETEREREETNNVDDEQNYKARQATLNRIAKQRG
jgi:hypothetical protein